MRACHLTIPAFLLSLPVFLLAAEEEEAVTVFQRVSPSVVGLESITGAGTGILLSEDGLVLTNAHVVAVPLPFKCLVEVIKGTKTETVVYQKVKVLGAHPKLDLAIVKIDPAEHRGAVLKPATINKNPPLTGQRVYAVGNPGNNARVKLAKTMTSGLLSGVDRLIDGVSYLQISAPINPGNSGGPLVDKTGQVIGVVTLKLTDVENVGFALPLTEFKADEFKPLRERVAAPEKALQYIQTANKILAEVTRLQVRGQGKSPQAEVYRLLVVQVLHEALLHDPSNGAVYATIGAMLDGFEEFEQAEGYYLAGLEAAAWTNDAHIYRAFGLHLLRRKRPDDAVAVWGEGLAKHPHSAALLWQDLAMVHRDRQNWREAGRCGAAVALLNDPSTRVEVAREISRLSFQNSPADQQAALKSEYGLMGEELLRRTLIRNALLAAKRPVLTKPFAEFLQRNHWSLPSDAAVTARPFPLVSPRVQDLATISKHGAGAEWTSEGGRLRSPETGLARRDATPAEIPEEYDLVVSGERLKGGNALTLGFYAHGGPAAMVVDFNRSVSGVAGYKTSLYREPVLPENQPVSLVVQVRKSGVRLRVDEREVLAVEETGAFPKPPATWTTDGASAWFVGSNQSSFAVHGWWLIKALEGDQPIDSGNPVLAQRQLATTSVTPSTRPAPAAPGPAPSAAAPVAGVLEVREIARVNETGWGMKSLAVSPDGKYVAGGKPDNAVWMIDVAKNAKIFDTGRMTDFNAVEILAFSPQGDKLLAGERKGKIRIWNVRDGLLTLDRDYVGHGGEISCLQVSGDGKLVLSGSKDERLRLWELATGREQFAWDGFKSGPKACQFLPNGDGIATDGESLFKLNLKEGRSEKLSVKLRSYTTQAAAFTPDGLQVAVADGYEVRRWNTSDFKELPTCKTTEMIWSAHFAADGKRLHTGGRGKLTIWDTVTAQPLDVAAVGEFYLQAIASTPDGRRFAAIGSAAGQPLQVFEAK